MSVPQGSWSKGGGFFREIPATKVIALLMAASFLAAIVTRGSVNAMLDFQPFALPNTLTGIVTYPLVFGGAGDLINLLLSGLMLWWFGGSLERSWGARRYLVFLLIADAAAALLWTAGVWLFHGPPPVIAGPWLMIATVITAWAWLNPEETILFWFVLPMRAKWIGWLTILLLFFLYPAYHGFGDARLLVLGFFALGGVAVSYLYARYHRDWVWILRPRPSPARRLRHPSSTPLGSLLRPWREWQRRRRIAHLQQTLIIDEEKLEEEGED
jgi:membrane associated rhomboid family serine protease